MQDVMDDINLFSVITVLSFLLSCPLMFFAEGIKFTPGYLQSTVSVSKFKQDIYFNNQLCHRSPNNEVTIILLWHHVGPEPPRALRESSARRSVLPWLPEGEEIIMFFIPMGSSPLSLSPKRKLCLMHGLPLQWQLSYLILSRVSPVTHSVANCVKRVVVIVSSVLFFSTPISPVNALGR